MALTVPYSGTASESLQATPIPEMSPRVPATAFGGEVSQAISSLGSTVKGAGDELFGRAIALQNLNNENEARDADTKYMLATGQLHVQYNTLEGKDRVDAYPKYQSDLMKARSDISGTLSNPRSKQMFEQSSLATMGQQIIAGGTAAAAAHKDWTLTGSTSRIAAATQQAAQNPGDEVTFQNAQRTIRKETATIAGVHGYGDNSAQETQLVLENNSTLWASRLEGLAKSDPYKAKDLLEQNRGQMTQDTYNKAEATIKDALVRNLTSSVNSDIITTDPSSAKRPERNEQERVAQVTSAAKTLFPNDPKFVEQAREGVRVHFQRTEMDRRDAVNENSTTVQTAINGEGLPQGARLPTTMEELRSLKPEIAKAIDDSPPEKKTQYLKALGNNAKSDYPPSEASFKTFNYYLGLSQSPNPEDRQKFQDTNIGDLEIPRGDRQKLITRATSMIRQAGENPKVTQTQAYLRGIDIGPDPRRDPDDAHVFRGALTNALEDFHTTNQRWPTADEQKKIGVTLIQQQPDTTGKWTFGVFDRSSPLYQNKPGSEEVQTLKKFYQDQGQTLTDEEATRELGKIKFRHDYNLRYGTPK